MNPKKPRPKCPVCGEEPARSFYKYCSNACQMEFQHQIHVENWKSGKTMGLNSIGLVKQAARPIPAAKRTGHCASGYHGVLLDKDAASAAHI